MSAKADAPKRERHSWIKIREHVRICQKCGCGKVNREVNPSYWETLYHLPTGVSKVLKATPPCEVGPRTVAYLKKHWSAIVCADAAPWNKKTESAKEVHA